MAQTLDAWLNQYCQCQAIDLDALQQNFASRLAEHLAGIPIAALQVFSAYPVFINTRQQAIMQETIAAIEAVVALDAFRSYALQGRPASTRHRPAAQGVFFGFDFHIGSCGPQLIEVNTNAGGAYYNLVLAEAQQACCPELSAKLAAPTGLPQLEDSWLAMFRREWQLARGPDTPLRCLAIVDDKPTSQFLYPEFLLFQALFARAGIKAIICDPRDLEWRDGSVFWREDKLDLIYNRTTDFYLSEERSALLLQAFLQDAVVLTPHPYAYGVYADKRNLVTWTDDQLLADLGVAPYERAVLAERIPSTRLVSPQNADELWRMRRQLFFKPVNGYGSKAAYRGEKLTKKMWELIVSGHYVAQQLIPPSERHIKVGDATVPLKIDLRNYTYQGTTQMLAARLYQGQATNLRTAGGGFAPLYISPTN